MEIITDEFENISINQLYSKLSIKYAKLDKIEQEESVKPVQSGDYIDTHSVQSTQDEKDFERVLQKFKNKDAEVRTHEQTHATIGYTTTPISYDYQKGPDGKLYAVGGSVHLDTSLPDDPKAAAFKLDMIQKAASGPTDLSGADRAIATQSNLNKILLQLQEQENSGTK